MGTAARMWSWEMRKSVSGVGLKAYFAEVARPMTIAAPSTTRSKVPMVKTESGSATEAVITAARAKRAMSAKVRRTSTKFAAPMRQGRSRARMSR